MDTRRMFHVFCPAIQRCLRLRVASARAACPRPSRAYRSSVRRVGLSCTPAVERGPVPGPSSGLQPGACGACRVRPLLRRDGRSLGDAGTSSLTHPRCHTPRCSATRRPRTRSGSYLRLRLSATSP